MFLFQMVMLLTGLLMAVFPESCTRRESRGDKDAVQRTKTMGIWLFFAAVIWFFTGRFL